MAALLSLFTGSTFKLIAAAVALFGLVALGAYGQHKIDADALDKLKAGYAQAQAAAVAQAAAEQKRMDDNALAASQAEMVAQQRRAATLQQELADVPTHVVTKAVPCIPYGLVRVLDAAVLGIGAGSLDLPSGKSDATCSTLTANDLARAVISNYGRYRSLAEQHNALVALLRRQQLVEKH